MRSKPRRSLAVGGDRKQAAGATPAAAGERRWSLLVRTYCHLCDEMRAELLPLLEGSGIGIVEIDVDADPRLEALYGERVPVLFAGTIDATREVCALRLDAARVAAALQAARGTVERHR